MKKISLFFTLTTSVFSANAQTIIDTVSTGATYANQVWYSLANDNQNIAPKNNWDLAFDVSGQGSTILINSITGTTLWNYPTADTSGWNSVDTSGINSWPKRWNSDTSWAMGAIGRYASATNPNDLDWGIYSQITHIVTGDSLYVIKLANGAYKKLQIKTLSGGIYSFRYADLNGSNLQNASLTKSAYSNQNFGYYSLQNNTALAREPLSASWDLLFTQYTTFIPSPYTVTGILHNKGVRVAQAKPVANPGSYINWTAHSFNSNINEIGYDWKVFTSSFVVEDSLVYFIKAKNGDLWKVIPIDFGGSSNGNHIFSKEKLTTVGLIDNKETEYTQIALYPNPSQGENVSVVISKEKSSDALVLNIYDLNGKLLQQQKLDGLENEDINVIPLNTQTIPAGIYIVNITTKNASINQKLILNK